MPPGDYRVCWYLILLTVSAVQPATIIYTILEETARGWKGAAFAAFGDIVEAFFKDELEDVGEDPLEGIKEGVKLGESTLKRFLLALPMIPS
jgi:hypothetical protein